MNTVNGTDEKKLLSLAKNSGLGVGGRIFFLFSRFVITLLITRTVGPELYGLLVLAMGMTTFLESVSHFGFETTMVKYTAQYMAQKNVSTVRAIVNFGLKVTLILSLVLASISFLFADQIAVLVFNKANLAPVLRVMLVGVPFMSVVAIFLSALQGAKLLKYRILIQQFMMPMFRFIVVAVALSLGFKIVGVAWAWVLTAVFGAALATVIQSKKIGLSFKSDSTMDKKELLSFSVLLLASQILYQNINGLGTLIIGIFLTADQVGIYGVAMRTVPFMLIPFVSFSAIFSPFVSELFTKGRMKELENMYKTGNKWVMTASLPLFVLIVFFSEQIASFFGSGFKSSAPIMVIVLIGQMVNICTGSTGIILSMTGKAHYNLFNSASLCILNIVLTLLLVPRFGLMGAASAYSVSIVTIQLLQIAEVWRLYRMHPYRLDTFKPVICGLLAASVIYLLKQAVSPSPLVSIPVLSSVFLACYGALLLIAGLSSDDRVILERVRYKYFT